MKYIIIIGVLAVLLALSTCVKESSKPEAEQSEQYKEAKKLAWIEEGKKRVVQKLKDQSSAQFYNLTVSRKGGMPMVCGEVNAKNSFGDHTGWQKFISAGSPDLTFLEEQVKGFDSVWLKYCS